nr:MAG TPA: hypothetical protein [Caudoviricetes sp.]
MFALSLSYQATQAPCSVCCTVARWNVSGTN